MSRFQKATKATAKLRMALYGASGTGKTYTSLLLAKALGKSVAVIDTEHGSASKYAGTVADFDVCELSRFEPANYIDALKDAVGYDVVVIDSLSHAWMGKGGLLDQADAKGGKFQAWRELTPQQHALVEAILAHPAHLIGTMRAKTEYEVSRDDKGKATVEKLGTAPIQREGIEYEFDLAGMMDQQNTLHVMKSRCPTVQGAIRKPGADLAAQLLAWLSDGVAPTERPSPPTKPQGIISDVAMVMMAEDGGQVHRILRAQLAIQEAKDAAELEAIARKLAASPKEVQKACASTFAARAAQLREAQP